MGVCLGTYVFRTVIVILWWSESPHSRVILFWKLWGRFVKITPIELRFNGFLKHVASLIKFFRLYESQNAFMSFSWTSSRQTNHFCKYWRKRTEYWALWNTVNYFVPWTVAAIHLCSLFSGIQTMINGIKLHFRSAIGN